MARLIKRYDNRKLYDTQEKRYVTLEDVGALVRQGNNIQVVDNATGEDLTAQTLTRIIVEGDRTGRARLPADLLHELVRWGGTVVAGTAEQLEEGLENLIRASLERIGPLREIRQDMERLRERMARLEALLAELTQGEQGFEGGGQ